MGYRDMYSDNPSRRIIATALNIGSVSLVVGCIGPLLLSGSNLGPLLGILVTGPVGTLVGALIGIVLSALHAGGHSIRAELWWLGFVWGLTLLVSLAFATLLPPGFVLLGLQGLVVASGAFLLGSSRVRRSLPELARKCGPVLLCAAVLILLTSMFPPVRQPSWRRLEQARGRASASEPLPKFAFFLDSRFNASRDVPEFEVDVGRLAREWFVIAAVAGIVSLFIAARIKRVRFHF